MKVSNQELTQPQLILLVAVLSKQYAHQKTDQEIIQKLGISKRQLEYYKERIEKLLV